MRIKQPSAELLSAEPVGEPSGAELSTSADAPRTSSAKLSVESGREGAASSGRSAAVGKRGRGGTIASEHRHGDGERTCRGEKDARIGAANGNGDGPAHVDGNGVAEAKCDSAVHGRGAQADRAAQAEADCAQAEANRAQAEPETDGA